MSTTNPNLIIRSQSPDAGRDDRTDNRPEARAMLRRLNPLMRGGMIEPHPCKRLSTNRPGVGSGVESSLPLLGSARLATLAGNALP